LTAFRSGAGTVPSLMRPKISGCQTRRCDRMEEVLPSLQLTSWGRCFDFKDIFAPQK
jgi:hypothetical protein